MVQDSAQAALAEDTASPYEPYGRKFSSDNGSSVEARQVSVQLSVAQSVVQLLEELGIVSAFGVSGGAMATLWAAMSDSHRIQVIHCRHESGATFAAAEASLASDRPIAAFCTAGPGLTNALTGMFAARGEGAKVVLLSACTSTPQRGRWAIQETSPHSLPTSGLFTSGALFNYATVVESAEQLPQIARQLALGFSRPEGFVAHLSFPTAVQSQRVSAPLPPTQIYPRSIHTSPAILQACAAKLSSAPFAIWLGYGARHASAEIRELAEKTGAAVMCSPRAKGIFPESHPQYVGVTGLGGHSSVFAYMQEQPLWTLVLGTRLGEPTSFYSPAMMPARGFIHVDIDPQVPGVAYSTATTVPVQSEVGAFVRGLMPLVKSDYASTERPHPLPNPEQATITSGQPDCVRPEILMQAIQQEIVEASDAVILAESGNSFTWATHWLRFDQPHRYRVSTGVGAMGHAITGVVGVAQSRGGKAVAITGDGSMLMNSEISTAVKYNIPAVWIVLNDARYNMCFQGMALLGLKADALMPQTDFVMVARGMGANGVHVNQESQLEEALRQAIASPGPFVIDVHIDASRQAPSKGRNQSLIKQGTKTPETAPAASSNGDQVSFPLV
ncbi:MAG: thiamine pyrophosphate-dependent enzyme [Phormidesmis sp.]